ncbi:nitrate/nitrite two-component system sensor histidine kinase [Oceanisphaera avium]|uniref:Sensor protein n=2 Tax=Oceanisphaera avium TaxID=1903694 RepID=A0A1Y0D0H5_9GAMM|nr:nitrate/nitrite two-component system sensor histidine kinase [Oceanisphaera avium]
MYQGEAIRGDAEAINKSGSLRMQAYRLALLSRESNPQIIADYIVQFENTLNTSALLSAIEKNDQPALSSQYARVVYQWQELMLPLLQKTPLQQRDFNVEVPIFVTLLDELVKELQLESEYKLHVIRSLQVGTLFICVMLGIIVTLRVHNNVLIPLKELVNLAKKIGRGSFEGRVKVIARNELGVLADTLNQMSAQLSELYTHLEQKVDEKTQELQLSNRSLALLFNSAQRLYNHSGANPQPIFAELLKPIEQTLNLGPVSLCLTSTLDNPNHEAHSALTSTPGHAPDYCQLPNCAQCPLFINKGLTEHGTQVVSFAIRGARDDLGQLRVEVPLGTVLEHWQQQLITALTELFSASLNLHHLGHNQARIALMEERAVIARELHDSLAQVLSYQKIQLARLKKQIALEAPPAEINDTVIEIQTGLSSAYRQLRELLVTFRIKLDTPGLGAALHSTVGEFSELTEVNIQTQYRLEHCPLTPNEEIHCLQIIREALSNVVKHAQAQHCMVTLYQEESGTIHLCIEDDGIGITSSDSPAGHYGLSILTERAHSLSGDITIEALEQGTGIYVQFLPHYKRCQ